MGKDDLVERSESRATVVSDHNDGRHDEIGDMHLSARQKLNPQPTDDPNDPLNWPLWLKVSQQNRQTVTVLNVFSLSS